ncbi:MAG: hypothetical protein QOG03_1098 [Actinomycetota bacterium]|nr:hypothetical protein [Actinomycetota bacterium]
MTDAALSPYVPRLLQEWGDGGEGPSWKVVDSTLVFVDLSGFTAMSERLARLGRVGAEEVSEVIGSTFAELLALAYAMGGSLLKFGGDAMLLLFGGEHHARRGARAAWDMRGALRRLGSIPTSAGGVRLKMTAGVHSGAIPLFLVGRSHRELFVVGPEASTVVAMEGAASAGQIVISPATAACLTPSNVGDALGPGRLLRSQPRAVAAPAGPPSAAQPSRQFVPHAIREHVLGGGAEPEHRQVTVAFVHFDGTDELVQAGGEEKVARLLDELVTSAQAAANEHGITIVGTDIDDDGGKIVLVAGAPVSHEDDSERMVRALRSILSGGRGLTLRVGTHRGPVFAGDIGPPYRRSYTVMGDVVNTAARIMAHAEPGQLLATAEVLDDCDTHFAATEQPAFRAKGKSAPLATFAVGEPLDHSNDEDPSELLLPLCARQPELERMQGLVDAAAAGKGGAAELVGDAGMGKSRLVEELKASRPDTPWLTVTCQRYDQQQPWFVVRTVLRQAAIDPALVDSTFGSATDAEALAALDERGRRDQLHHVLAQILSLSLRPGTCLIVDDAQWMDDASAAFIAYLRTRAPSSSWVVLLARRPGTPPVAGLDSTIELEPLDRDAALELVRLAAPGRILPHDAAVLAERAGGHPLFLLELVRGFLDEADTEVLPPSVEASVAARIDRLAPKDRSFLRDLSVLGSTFAFGDVAALGHDVRAARRQLAKLSEFVAVSRDQIHFRQSMFRDVAYESLARRRRRTLHAAVLDHLEATAARTADAGDAAPDEGELLAALSLHASMAGRVEAAWRHGRAAARHASRSAAFVAMAVYCRRSLDVARQLRPEAHDEATTWRDLGQALFLSGSLAEATTAFGRARRLAQDNTLVTELHLFEGITRAEQGHHDAALRWFLRGLRLPQVTGDPEAARFRNRLRNGLATERLAKGDLDDARRLFEDALAEARSAGDVPGEAHALGGLLRIGVENNDQTTESGGFRALEIFRSSGHARPTASVLCNLGNLASNLGRWDDARSHYDEAYDLLEQSGDGLGAATVAYNIGDLLGRQGHLDEARHRFVQALDAFIAGGHGYAHLARIELARLAARAGDFAEASVLFEEGATGVRTFGIASLSAMAEVIRADIHVLAGRPDAALDALDHAGSDAALEYQPTIRRLRGLALIEKGDDERGGTWLDEALALSRQSNNPYEEALTLDALLRLARARADECETLRTARDGLFRRLGVEGVPGPVLSNA